MLYKLSAPNGIYLVFLSMNRQDKSAFEPVRLGTNIFLTIAVNGRDSILLDEGLVLGVHSCKINR